MQTARGRLHANCALTIKKKSEVVGEAVGETVHANCAPNIKKQKKNSLREQLFFSVYQMLLGAS